MLKKAEINIKSPAPQRNKVTGMRLFRHTFTIARRAFADPCLICVVSAAVDIKAEYSQILEGDLKTINEFFKLKLEELRSRLEQLKRVTKRGEVTQLVIYCAPHLHLGASSYALLCRCC